MRNWSSIEELERGTRNSFLINRKYTVTEIYRMEGMFRTIEQLVANMENSASDLKTSVFRDRAKHEIDEETLCLLIMCECLEEILDHNQRLENRFFFEITRIRKKTDRILRGRQLLAALSPTSRCLTSVTPSIQLTESVKRESHNYKVCREFCLLRRSFSGTCKSRGLSVVDPQHEQDDK